MQTSLPEKRRSDTLRAALRPERLIPALMAGLLIGILEIALSTSFAALIFSGEMAVHLPRGIGMALFSATVGITITSLLTSYPAIMSGNQDAPAAILAVMTAAIGAAVTADEARLATVIITVALTAVLTGGFLFFLGARRQQRQERLQAVAARRRRDSRRPLLPRRSRRPPRQYRLAGR